MSPFDRAHMTSYWRSIVTMALSPVVSEIFNVEKCRTLKSGSEVTQGHWKWYDSIDCVSFPISVFSNFVPKTHRFWDIRLPKCRDLENRVRGPSSSSSSSSSYFICQKLNNHNNIGNTTQFGRQPEKLVLIELVAHCNDRSITYTHKYKITNSYTCTPKKLRHKAPRFKIYIIQIRSLEMSPFDRAHMTSYWRSIVTMALSPVVSEIFNVEKCRDLEIGVRGHSRSLKVVPFGRSCMVSY